MKPKENSRNHRRWGSRTRRRSVKPKLWVDVTVHSLSLTEISVALKADRGPSFFDMLAEQAKNLITASELLQSLFASKGEERAALRDRLHDVEHQADENAHAFIQKLNQSFITPFDRADMSNLSGLLDDCVDHMDEAGDLTILYKLDEIPPLFQELLNQQVNILARCSRLTADAMPKLKKPMDLKPYWLEINILENQGDQTYRRTLANLFDSDLDPITIIKLKDIVAVLEKATDAFEQVAHAVETIAVKES